MFGLGMNNNGTGLVLASIALSSYPNIMVPIIFYNLVQHIAAGTLREIMNRKATKALELLIPATDVRKRI
jgi:BASS family bile acid:Na+ symporter